ncbi:hypothetical protein SEA_SIXAMA_11 [Gordonia phage Sixama]|uniref:Uncharacterized protein n=1 Tax=Gordonia phage Sixama TaxID=2653271 RepID=A0A5Q2F0B2_9CAUD|nr:hypothetical protein PP302_gp011 [Gordonia phage Sixama]QGF20190.1 hypothetical protein SEA_SIXAMA_11 [Gordonia phage Sixama]
MTEDNAGSLPQIRTPEGVHERSEVDQRLINSLENTIRVLQKDNAAHSNRWPHLTAEIDRLKTDLKASREARQRSEKWYRDCARANQLFAEAVDEGTERIVRENVELRRKVKDLGKNYGRASQTIHDLRAELVYLRTNPRADAQSMTELREQIKRLNEMVVNLRQRTVRHFELRSILRELAREIRGEGESSAD